MIELASKKERLKSRIRRLNREIRKCWKLERKYQDEVDKYEGALLSAKTNLKEITKKGDCLGIELYDAEEELWNNYNEYPESG